MSDKYPEETDRRRFVKGVVGGAALSGGGTLGAVSVDAVTNPSGRGGGLTLFYGIENTDGPAPRAMPQIPIEVEEDTGFLKGRFPEITEKQVGGQTRKVAEEEIGDITYSNRWFQYCGVQTYPGVRVDIADEFDDYLRYAPNEEKFPEGLSWQAEDDRFEPGDKVNVEHFQDYESFDNDIGTAGLGKPARVTWRSQGLKSEETMVAEVIRSTRVEEMSSDSEWLEQSTQDGFIGYLDKCTHFCCVPAFKGFPGSAKFEGEDGVYCPCHQSVYDPFSIVKKQFTALPRPENPP